MSWLNSLFSKKENPKSTSPDDAALKIRKEIQDNLELLKFLCTCGTFNLDKLRAFMALSAQRGKQFGANAVRQMENANQMIGGYEKLRMDVMIPGSMEAYMTFFKLLADMRPDPATTQFLKPRTTQKTSIRRSIVSRKPRLFPHIMHSVFDLG